MTDGQHQTPGKRLDKTEDDVKPVDGRSGQSNTSSHDTNSRFKAGSDTGAGGGKKQEKHQGQ